MPTLADVLPEFARDRAATRRDLADQQAKLFDEWSEAHRQRQLDAINRIIEQARDAQPGASRENAAPANPDLAELRKALELRGIQPNPIPSLEKQIRQVNDI